MVGASLCALPTRKHLVDVLASFVERKGNDFRLIGKDYGLKGEESMKKKLLVCGAICLLCLAGCGKRELLQEKLNVAEIDKVVVTMAMGNPVYGADCKVITDAREVQEFVDVFNNAYVDEKVNTGEEWVAESGSYAFYRGDELLLKLNVNGNDPERIWINDAFYEIDYPDHMKDPYKQYSQSTAETIVVDANGDRMIRPGA